MSRTLIQSILEADTNSDDPGSLKSLGVQSGKVYAAESADDITVMEFPFITTRWGNITRGVGSSRRQLLDVWAYDRALDYDRIDKILLRVEFLLTNVEAEEATEGFITTIEWQGSSPDLRDDGYDARTRNSTFEVVGSTR